MERRMKFVIYGRKAAIVMGASDVGDILLASRMNNQKRGVTGALMYRDGFFLQVLEGRDDVLDDLVGRIRNVVLSLDEGSGKPGRSAPTCGPGSPWIVWVPCEINSGRYGSTEYWSDSIHLWFGSV